MIKILSCYFALRALPCQVLIRNCAIILGCFCSTAIQAANWPQFRGPNSQGISAETNLPETWNETQNIRWQYEFPGPGSSSPIVWGDRVFVTCHSGYAMVRGQSPGDPKNLKRHLICLNKNTGEVLWKKDVSHEGRLRSCGGNVWQATYAGHTPVTDGRAVYCYFGNHGAIAFDMKGNLLWKGESYEVTRSKYGSAASPVLVDDVLIVNASLEGQRLIGLNKNTGEELWRVEENVSSYTTPVLAETPAGKEVIINGAGKALACDPGTGEVLWSFQHGHGSYIITSPALYGDNVYLMNGLSKVGRTVAIRTGGRGDLTGKILWKNNNRGIMASPVVVDGLIYAVASTLKCFQATTGELVYEERLPEFAGRTFASPTAGDGKIYIPGNEGRTYVIKSGPEFELLSVNQIEDDDSLVQGSIAVSDGKLFLRSQKALYCVAK